MSQFAKSSQHPIDGFIIEFDRALRSIVGATPMRRPVPDSSAMSETELSADEKKHAAGLMRVNHVGEVCAQALYQSQKLHAKSDDLKNKLSKTRDNNLKFREKKNVLDLIKQEKINFETYNSKITSIECTYCWRRKCRIRKTLLFIKDMSYVINKTQPSKWGDYLLYFN